MAQLHLGPTHVRIRPWNSRKLPAVLNSLGKLFHTRADSNLNDLCPYVTVLTVGILTVRPLKKGDYSKPEQFWGKMNFSGHHYRQIVLYTVIHAMPEFALGWVPGSGTCLYQNTLYRSVSCRRRSLCGTPA